MVSNDMILKHVGSEPVTSGKRCPPFEPAKISIVDWLPLKSVLQIRATSANDHDMEEQNITSSEDVRGDERRKLDGRVWRPNNSLNLANHFWICKIHRKSFKLN